LKIKKLVQSIAFLLTMSYAILNSAWLDNVPTFITQPDGTKINCLISGDEFYRRLHDENNYTVIQHPTSGWYVYATNSGKELIATDLIFGKDNPESADLKPKAMIDPEIIKLKAQEHWDYPKITKSGKKEQTQVNNTGTIQNIVIYIRFSGESEFTDDTSTYHSMFNASSGNSMYAYYREVSYNTLSIYSHFYPRPSNNIVKSYQDNQLRNYFRPYHAQDNPNGYQNSTEKRTREHSLLQRAVEGVRSEIPSGLVIDNDNDGYVDNVCFVISGANDGWSDLLWPHMWALYTYNVTINGKRVYLYNFQLQNFLKSSGNGVLSHEMFHTLGAPDLYHYSQDEFNPVWRWDIMANTTNPPQHMGAWMKRHYGGWISNIPEITANGTYSLNPITSSTNNCYIIKSPNSTKQWFLLEYRKTNATFESAIPGSGLIVYRVIPDSIPNGNMNGPPDEVYVYRPGGTPSSDGTPANAFFNSAVGRVEINDGTNPSSFLVNGSAGGLSIHSIGSAGGTISFTVGVALNPPTLVFPQNNAGTIDLNPVLRWSKINSATSYDIEVATNSNFANKVFTASGVTDTIVTVTPALTNATTYYWHVRSVASGTSNWTATGIFTTKLVAPALSEPADSEYGVFLRDTLKWQPVTGANTYAVELSKNLNFTTTELQQTGITTTSLVLPNGVLENNTLYYWRVKAIKTSPSTESDWSAIRNFVSILTTPTLTAPKNDSLGIGLSGTLSWVSVSGATFYNLQLSKHSDFSVNIINNSGLTNTSFDFSDLEYNTTYYWKVSAGNSNQTGFWSSIFSFTTNLNSPKLVSPNNDITKVSINTQLIWNKVAGADIYHLQVASDTNMLQLVININNIANDSVYTCNGLASKTKYFWRVRASSHDGRIGNWSDIRSYTTILGTPSIPSPSNNGTGVSVNGTFIWDAISGANKYHLQFSKSNNFNTLLINDSSITGTSLVYSNLEPDVAYYWKVKAKSVDVDGDWSSAWTFTTGLGKVELSYPSNNSKGIQVNGQLTWNSMSGAQSYDVQISTQPDFSTKLVDATGVSTTNYSYSQLESNKLYYWKVRAVSSSGPGAWSATWNFTTTAGEPGLIMPANEQGGMRLSDTLRWTTAPGAQSYNIIIAKDQGMTNIVAQQSGLTKTEFVYSGFNYYTNYYWKVNASNNDGNSPWSEIRKFTTMIDKPILNEPENDIKNAPVSGSLSWDNVLGASGYSLWISTSNNFTSSEIEENGLTDNTYSYENLQNSKTYYWKVIAENSFRNSETSEVWKFKTIIGCPALNSPLNDQSNMNYNGLLTWNHVDGSDYYKVQLSKNSNFNNPIIDTSGIIFTFCNFNNLNELTKYYWRVGAYNEFGKCEWSDVWTFTTKDPTSIDDNEINSISFTAHPNPFSSEINFLVDLPSQQNGVVEIYNSIGLLVDAIELNATYSGNNSFSWEPKNLESGIYNVLYKSSSTILSLKIVLIK